MKKGWKPLACCRANWNSKVREALAHRHTDTAQAHTTNGHHHADTRDTSALLVIVKIPVRLPLDTDEISLPPVSMLHLPTPIYPSTLRLTCCAWWWRKKWPLYSHSRNHAPLNPSSTYPHARLVFLALNHKSRYSMINNRYAIRPRQALIIIFSEIIIMELYFLC